MQIMRAAASLRQGRADKRLVSKSLPLLVLSLLIVSGISLSTVLVPSAQATNGVVKDMTFLLHSVNATETAKPLPGGGSTLTYFDTTLEFNDVNVSVLVEGTQKVLQWFLVPDLAGDFGVEGFTLRIWSNSSTAASSNAQVTVEIHELNETSSILVHSENFGSQTFPVTPTLMAWNATLAVPHTFSVGSSIELRLTANPGAMQGVWFHYDTPQVNSRVSLSGPDSLDVAGIPTLDSDRNVSVRFDPNTENRTIYIQARLTDPLGGYDIRWVNLTLTSPTGLVLLDNVSMARVAGTPIDFENLFEIEWNYTGQTLGQYEVLIWALDQNGHNHFFFFQQFSFGAYADVGIGSFFIGGPPLYANVRVQDSQDMALVGAEVILVSGGLPIEEETTNATGMANFTLAAGNYEFWVEWQGVRVASLLQSILANVTASDPLVVVSQVHHPTFQALDAEGTPLPGASLLFVHPNGGKRGPFQTDPGGQVTLAQVPVGEYIVSAAWRGVPVFEGSLQVTSDAVLTFETEVYELTLTVTSADASPLPGVFVSVTEASGLVFDAGVSDGEGTVILLLPRGEYTVETRYITSHMGSLYDSGVVTRDLTLTGSTSVTLALEDFPPPFTSTLLFLFLLVYLGTVAGLIALLLVLRWRRRKRP